MRRRSVLSGLTLAVLAGCTSKAAGESDGLWHAGAITIGTGPTNGTFNQVGGGYADVINRHLPGYEAQAVPTNGAGENLERLTRGDVDVAFTFADVAGDAVAGLGLFQGRKLPVRALARVFNSYTHLAVRVDASINAVKDLRNKRVATGPVGSGTEEVSGRLLRVMNLDPDKDIKRTSASLSQMTASLKAGQIDAMFYASGLPTTGMLAMFKQVPGKIKLIPLDLAYDGLQAAHPGVYQRSVIPREAYGFANDVATIAIPNLIVVHESMPDQVAKALTRLIFEYQPELAAVHPEGKNIIRNLGPQTDPVALHPGARSYYDQVA